MISYIPAGDGKIANLFLQCIAFCLLPHLTKELKQDKKIGSQAAEGGGGGLLQLESLKKFN